MDVEKEGERAKMQNILMTEAINEVRTVTKQRDAANKDREELQTLLDNMIKEKQRTQGGGQN